MLTTNQDCTVHIPVLSKASKPLKCDGDGVDGGGGDDGDGGGVGGGGDDDGGGDDGGVGGGDDGPTR